MTRLLSIAAFALCVVGCATHHDRLVGIRSAYHTNHLDEARTKIDTAITKNRGEADVLKLDRATVLLTDGKPKEAEQLFREVRDQFDAKEGKDLKEGVMAMVSDDQQLAYAGEDYEKVLIRFMLSLSNLLTDGADATAYALQVNQKQQEIIETSKCLDDKGKNLKADFKLVPAGSYLYAALREETHTNYDDVARSLEQIAKWQPDFPPLKQDMERAKNGHHSQPGCGVVYVFAMVGRGPYKEERVEPVSSVSLLIADRMISALGKQSLPPTIAPIKVPRVVRPYNSIDSVVVGVDDRIVGPTQTITDVGKMAVEQSEAVRAETIARAVVRRVIKKGVIYGIKEAVGSKNVWTSLAFNAVGVVWEALESADTRCWGLLPDKIQVLRIELPVGDHTIHLKPNTTNIKSANSGEPTQSVRVHVDDGRNTYVVASFPDANLTGKINTNRPAK